MAEQAPSEQPCKWCGRADRCCDYEEYAAPCMAAQIEHGELVRVLTPSRGGAQGGAASTSSTSSGATRS